MRIHLKGMKIKSAKHQVTAAPWMLRNKFSVAIEKTARDLDGPIVGGERLKQRSSGGTVLRVQIPASGMV
jgi:hypothetical protein